VWDTLVGVRAMGHRNGARTGAGRIWLSAACIVALLAAGSVPALNALRYTPAQAVLHYLRAVGAADAHAALRWVRAPATDSAAFSEAVLDNAADLPQKPTVTAVESTGDTTARVSVEFLLGTASRKLDLDVVAGPGDWGMYRSWAVDVPAWPTLDVSGGVSNATVNGQSLKLGAADHLPVLFPATYSVASNATYLKATPVRAEALEPGAEVPVTLNPQPTAALTRAVNDRVRSQLDACVKQKVLMPTGCAMGYQSDNDILGDVTWRVTDYPDIRLSSTPEGILLRPAPATFTVSGRSRDAVSAYEQDFTSTVEVNISGKVGVTGDEVSFTPAAGGEDLGTAS
jgi:hypothetical protein